MSTGLVVGRTDETGRHEADTRRVRTTRCGLPWDFIVEPPEADVTCPSCITRRKVRT